ncbi:sigma-54-dependent transcriptional regulator [Desulfosarcina cetonica]|uniref:sigma-54-dependent transcriptional regulator n=1 Tax=Desulfosarcina cetonica TaxID=90730 RepID=UPI000A596031|nr:sigma-54 dependent transcriptional regulator [Desulfosarcina cetonica]
MNEPANEFGHILIIDDDPEVCGTLLSLLSRMQLAGESARSLNAGLAKLEKGRFDLVFLDVRLPDGNGLDALARIKLMPGSPEVIILTGQGDPDGAELAIQGGVWDYLVKPSPVKQTLLSIQRVLKYRKEKQGTTPVVALDLSHLVGRGSEMRGIQDFIAQAARSQAGVLINGETGTGKELTARTIHENGTRAANRFIVVDCAALTETLVESTLFGHRRGAFTGADRDRTGLIKLADGGTLFLDEVGEMPLNIQRVFLRVLQEKRFRPVGENREESSDFRIIAATNKNLEDEVRAGRFRDDLLFRLKTMNVTLPPLRCRKEDIRDLVMFHVRKLAKRYDTPEKASARTSWRFWRPTTGPAMCVNSSTCWNAPLWRRVRKAPCMPCTCPRSCASARPRPASSANVPRAHPHPIAPATGTARMPHLRRLSRVIST